MIYKIDKATLISKQLKKNRLTMTKQLIFFTIILCIVSACSKQNDIRGTFINDNSEEITIDCSYHIRTTHLSGKAFMPDNGNEIKLMNTSIKQDEITVAFKSDNLLSPFAKWDSNSDELIIGTDVYNRKSFANCK